MCSSNATSPAECQAIAPPETPTCFSESSAAGVRCIQGTSFKHGCPPWFYFLFNYTEQMPPVTTPVPVCNDFDLRLANTSVSFQDSYLVYAGNVETCINGTYSSICDIGWDDVEAQLICNALGYVEPYFRRSPI